jgi:hypothetical protein
MKTTDLMLVLASFLMAGGHFTSSAAAESAGDNPERQAVAFDTHNGYFVSNGFEAAAPTSFLVITNQGGFDRVFQVGMVMGDTSHRLPAGAFTTNLVVAVIHRGKALVTYKVESVEKTGKTLAVRYRTTTKPSASAEYACPLILSVVKGDYSVVEFVEDGRTVKAVPDLKSKG